MKTQSAQVAAHLHDPEHRHHLFIATLVFVFEIALTLGVEALVIHLLVTVGLFGREAADILFRG